MTEREAIERKRTGKELSICRYCAEPQHKHHLANFSDGPMIGASVLVCPTGVFEHLPKKPRPERKGTR